MKEKVAFLRFESELNYVRFLKAAVTPTLDFIASLVTICLSHGCFRASLADILLVASITSNLLMKSLPFSETLFHAGSLKLYLPVYTFCMIAFSFLPPNGGFPDRRINVMTPIDHKSHFSSYDLLSTSGAM